MSATAEIRSIVLQVGVPEKSFKDEDHDNYANDTEFSEEYQEIKRKNFIPKVT